MLFPKSPWVSQHISSVHCNTHDLESSSSPQSGRIRLASSSDIVRSMEAYCEPDYERTRQRYAHTQKSFSYTPLRTCIRTKRHLIGKTLVKDTIRPYSPKVCRSQDPFLPQYTGNRLQHLTSKLHPPRHTRLLEPLTRHPLLPCT